MKQTYQDFEYILIDNGSTDGCKEFMEQYAEQDSRIRLVRFEENRRAPIWFKTAHETARGQYIANLDSDDWWDINYLESLIGFLEKNNLDLAITGAVNYFEELKVSQVLRRQDKPIIMNLRQFAEQYPFLWIFASTNWANIMRTELFRKANFQEVLEANLSNAGDTVSMLKYLEHCRRIGIDDTALYHYRIRPNQVSIQYNPRRFNSNVYSCKAMQHFLESNHTYDQFQQEWMKTLYFDLTNRTLNLLNNSGASTDSKLAECMRIVTHPLTLSLWDSTSQEKEQWLQTIWEITLNAVEDQAFTDVKSLQSVLSVLAPRCGAVVTKGTGSLFMQEPDLRRFLCRDVPERMAKILLDLIAAKRYTKQYNLAEILQKLAADKPLLCTLDDAVFLREYPDIYWEIWQDNIFEALDDMTGLLLENKVRSAAETFLQLYISVAACLDQAPAFVFGKIRLAEFLFSQGQAAECRTVLEELKEMGVEDSAEIMDLRSRLGLPPQ